MCSATSPVLQEPPAAASEMPIRIKKTFPGRLSDFIPCDKCFYLACSSWVSQLHRAEQSKRGSGLAWARTLTVTHILGHPTAPSFQHFTMCSVRTQSPPGLSQGRDRGGEMHHLGQNSSAPGRATLVAQRAEPETGLAEPHPGSQLK